MKRIRNGIAKYMIGLFGAVLVFLVVQYFLLTSRMEPVHPMFVTMQVFCYMLLGAALFRGFIQRSRLAWLIARMMLAALFAVSLLFATFSVVLMLKEKSISLMVTASLLAAVIDGLLMGILFSLPVCDYFKPPDNQ